MTVRKPLQALALLSLTALIVIGTGSTAGAIETCEPTPESNRCFSSSSDTVIVDQPRTGTTDDIEAFRTRVVVQGPGGILFDQTVDDASDSSTVTNLIADAEASLTADGLQVASTKTSTPQRALANSTQEVVTTPDRDELSVQSEVFVGPTTAQVGPDRSESLLVPTGTTLVNVNTRTTRYVNVTTNTTNTYLTTATVTVEAVAPASASTTSTTTPTAAPSTTPPAAVSPASTAAPSGELARTGSSNGPWTAAGITLVLAGGACLHLSRRTARHEAPAPTP